MIPKIIHYCWFGKQPFSPTIELCLKSWKQYCPDYEIMRWDENNMPPNVPWIKAAYRNRKFAFVADYVRFYALYNYGGIYLDTDMLLMGNLDQLLDHNFFIGLEDASTVSMGIIGSETHEPFLLQCINLYTTHKFDVLNPLIITRIITPLFVELGYKSTDRNQQLSNGFYIYQSDYFYPIHYTQEFSLDDIQSYCTTNTLCVHLWNNSWMTEFQHIQNGNYKKGYLTALRRIKANPFLPIRYYYRLAKYTVRIIIGKY